MSITKQEDWDKWVNNNSDPYGKVAIDVAREVMRLLDEREGDFDTHKIICEADENIKTGGITGFMASCVAQMVSHCHSRGEEFRRKWNIDYDSEKSNEKEGAVVNPAILTIG
jgi:hypothetical protein